MYAEWCIGVPEKTESSVSPSGWMEEVNFVSWFRLKFVEHCKLRPNKKKLLIMDGYGSHISFDLIDLAIAIDIIIFCLPAHSSAFIRCF